MTVVVKNPPANEGDLRPKRNLAGYRPWGLKESDRNEGTQHVHTCGGDGAGGQLLKAFPHSVFG